MTINQFHAREINTNIGPLVKVTKLERALAGVVEVVTLKGINNRLFRGLCVVLDD